MKLPPGLRSFGLVTLLVVSVLAFRGAALAQTPLDITERLIAQVKAAQSMSPVIDAIDWEGAYKAISVPEKQALGYRSVQDFKRDEIDNFENSGAKIEDILNSAIKNSAKQNSGPQHEAALETAKGKLDSSLKNQADAVKQAFSDTTYAAGDSNLGATTATVKLSKTKGGDSVTQTLEFVKVEGSWKLKSGAPFNPTSTGSTAQGGLLGPRILSPGLAVGPGLFRTKKG